MLEKLVTGAATIAAGLSILPAAADASPAEQQPQDHNQTKRTQTREQLKKHMYASIDDKLHAEITRFNAQKKDRKTFFDRTRNKLKIFEEEQVNEVNQKIPVHNATAYILQTKTRNWLSKHYQTKEDLTFFAGLEAALDKNSATTQKGRAEAEKRLNQAREDLIKLDEYNKAVHSNISNYEPWLAYAQALSSDTIDERRKVLNDLTGKWYDFSNTRIIEKKLGIHIKAKRQEDPLYQADRLWWQDTFNKAASLVNVFLRPMVYLNLSGDNPIAAGLDIAYELGRNTYKIINKMTDFEIIELEQLEIESQINPKGARAKEVKERIAKLQKKYNENFARLQVTKGLEVLGDKEYEPALVYFKYAKEIDPNNSKAEGLIKKTQELIKQKEELYNRDFIIAKPNEREKKTPTELAAQMELYDHFSSNDLEGANKIAAKILANKEIPGAHGLAKIVQAFYTGLKDGHEAKISKFDELASEGDKSANIFAKEYLENHCTNPLAGYEKANSTHNKKLWAYILADVSPLDTLIDTAVHGGVHVAAKGLEGAKDIGLAYLVGVIQRGVSYYIGGSPVKRDKLIRSTEIAAERSPPGSKTKKQLHLIAAALLEKDNNYKQAQLHYQIIGETAAVERLEDKINPKGKKEEEKEITDPYTKQMIKLWQKQGSGTYFTRRKLLDNKDIAFLIGISSQELDDLRENNEVVGAYVCPTGVGLIMEKGEDPGFFAKLFSKSKFDQSWEWRALPIGNAGKFATLADRLEKQKIFKKVVSASDNFFYQAGVFGTGEKIVGELGFGWEIGRSDLFGLVRADLKSINLKVGNRNRSHKDYRLGTESSLLLDYDFEKGKYETGVQQRGWTSPNDAYDMTVKLKIENGEYVFSPAFKRFIAYKNFVFTGGASYDHAKGGTGGMIDIGWLSDDKPETQYAAVKQKLYEEDIGLPDNRSNATKISLRGRWHPKSWEISGTAYLNALLNNKDDENKTLENVSLTAGYSTERKIYAGVSFPLLPGEAADKIPIDLFVGYSQEKGLLFGPTIRYIDLPYAAKKLNRMPKFGQ